MHKQPSHGLQAGSISGRYKLELSKSVFSRLSTDCLYTRRISFPAVDLQPTELKKVSLLRRRAPLFYPVGPCEYRIEGRGDIAYIEAS